MQLRVCFRGRCSLCLSCFFFLPIIIVTIVSLLFIILSFIIFFSCFCCCLSYTMDFRSSLLSSKWLWFHFFNIIIILLLLLLIIIILFLFLIPFSRTVVLSSSPMSCKDRLVQLCRSAVLMYVSLSLPLFVSFVCQNPCLSFFLSFSFCLVFSRSLFLNACLPWLFCPHPRCHATIGSFNCAGEQRSCLSISHDISFCLPLSVCLSGCFSDFLSLALPVCLSIYLSPMVVLSWSTSPTNRLSQFNSCVLHVCEVVDRVGSVSFFHFSGWKAKTLFVCLFVCCLFDCLFIYLFICLVGWLFISLFGCLFWALSGGAGSVVLGSHLRFFPLFHFSVWCVFCMTCTVSMCWSMRL